MGISILEGYIRMRSFSFVLTAGVMLALTATAGAGSSGSPAAGGGSSDHELPEAKRGSSATATRTGDSGQTPSNKPDSGHGSHWAYSGRQGPKHWSDLSREYSLCKEGQMQSPIDLANGIGATGVSIEFDYKLTALNIVHNGHTVQVNYEPGSGITVGGKRYELLQFHFHTPSEHAFTHKQTAMEVHFVHKSADGRLAVVGALMEVGEENRALREIWTHLPSKAAPAKSHQNVLFNGRDLLPQDQRYFHYMGSLTTPPCSEGVAWFVFAQPIHIAPEQVRKFTQAVGENARPLQSLGNRLLLNPVANKRSDH